MFRLDEDNGIQWVEDSQALLNEYPAGSTGAFSSEVGLMKLSDDRKLSREDLEGIWNGFAGNPGFSNLKPVKKFRNRPYGVKQIWKAIQRLAHVDKKDSNPTPKKRSKSASAANGFPREGSKAARAIQLMKRSNGASGSELQEKLGWLPHTVRGFVSTIQSKHKIKVDATKNPKGMVYQIPA